MASDPKPSSSENKNVSIKGDVSGVVVVGDNNVVNNQTTIQKFFNIFKSDSETLEHRNRRILLGHVENAWIKGVLDASLHGAALLDLGIKQDPEAVTQYPWAIKRESTDATLLAGTSMLEIFDSIGMGRSLLILGAPGSGKTTMLLELARQLIQHAREDVTQPIPMVFNLASWTEKLTLADWLAQELNNLYSVPRKTAPDWVKGDKLLLLLDGLDEVRQESRAKCVEAINAFRKEHGMTSLAVCSRSQDYAELNTKLSFEGAIEVQSLTQKQITEFFNRFGKEMAGIKYALEKDSILREMAETPLFLSIILMAYRDKQDGEILVSGEEKERRKHLFDVYIERMFKRHIKNVTFKKRDVLYWLSYLANKMIEHNQVPYMLEHMQPNWLSEIKQIERYKLVCGLIFGLIFGLYFGLILELSGRILGLHYGLFIGLILGQFLGLFEGQVGLANLWQSFKTLDKASEISTVDLISWNWNNARKNLLSRLVFWSISGLVFGLIAGLIFWLISKLVGWLVFGLLSVLDIGLIVGLISGLMSGISVQQVDQTTYPGQKLVFTAKNSIFIYLFSALISGLSIGLFVGLFFGLFYGILSGPQSGLIIGLYIGLSVGLYAGPLIGLMPVILSGVFTKRDYGNSVLIRHYALRFILARNNLLPWRLVPFLDHCVDLIFLRRVGGGYIFVHRLLMEHFAEMYVEIPTSKGN